ncbi:hypothetical protein GGX14DRAFT_626752 [Mycena pura]|uniref:Uncharacterized protein n=1 Tax=Mycena pura TaxID=153505 RepID=A0AAD6YQK6_9AGAR|nr:hypothetical protein GGX14DRAFT_626752 [Mycena pura]
MPADENDAPPPSRRCKNSKCTRPAEDGRKSCDHCCSELNCNGARVPGRVKCMPCLETNRLASRKKREKQREAKEHGRKKARQGSDDESDGEDSDDSSDSIKFQPFASSELLFTFLQRLAKRADAAFLFRGSFTIPFDREPLQPKERVALIAQEVWRSTGYRFTVDEHKGLKTGHKTSLFCSQDLLTKKAPKPSQRPSAKPRETPGMKRSVTGSYF